MLSEGSIDVAGSFYPGVGYLSTRMARADTEWRLCWERCAPCAARHQKQLFDPRREAARTLDWLENALPTHIMLMTFTLTCQMALAHFCTPVPSLRYLNGHLAHGEVKSVSEWLSAPTLCGKTPGAAAQPGNPAADHTPRARTGNVLMRVTPVQDAVTNVLEVLRRKSCWELDPVHPLSMKKDGTLFRQVYGTLGPVFDAFQELEVAWERALYLSHKLGGRVRQVGLCEEADLCVSAQELNEMRFLRRRQRRSVVGAPSGAEDVSAAPPAAAVLARSQTPLAEDVVAVEQLSGLLMTGMPFTLEPSERVLRGLLQRSLGCLLSAPDRAPGTRGFSEADAAAARAVFPSSRRLVYPPLISELRGAVFVRTADDDAYPARTTPLAYGEALIVRVPSQSSPSPTLRVLHLSSTTAELI